MGRRGLSNDIFFFVAFVVLARTPAAALFWFSVVFHILRVSVEMQSVCDGIRA